MKLLRLNRIVALLALASYLIVTVFSLLHMAHMANADMPMGNCPYMVGGQSLCPMDAFSHIRSWQEFTSTTLTYFEVFAVTAFVFIPAFVFFVFSPPPLIPHRQRYKAIPLYQELFSNGILHPKAP